MKPAIQHLWVRRSKPLLFLACLFPITKLIYAAYTGSLGPEPIEEITFTTGDWTLRFLLLTLAITPIRRITKFQALIRLRRMIGLFAFFYAGLHFATYIVLEQYFDWALILEDFTERSYIIAGLTGITLMLPLAVTSTHGMQRRLGGRRWQTLHRLVYICAIAGVIHFLWLVKSDLSEPLIYTALLSLLLGYRVYYFFKGRIDKPSTDF